MESLIKELPRIEEHDWSCVLKERLRQALIESGPNRNPTTYKELADRLRLEPPQTIHRIVETLETLMEDDVAAGRPMLAALCVSKMRPGIPARGFFLAARVLGVFWRSDGPGGTCLPRDRAAARAFILWKLASASGARCLVKKPNEIRGIEQVRQETTSFFERLKTEASAKWRACTEHALDCSRLRIPYWKGPWFRFGREERARERHQHCGCGKSESA
jgi:hypothetical protein